MEILHCDKDLIVCIKPVGLDSEKGMSDALTAAVGGPVFAVHRLDKNVGGVMVYARTKAAAASLSAAIASGDMVKEYIAQVHGTPAEKGDWSDFLFKDSSKNKVFVVKKERRGVKAARLEFTRLTDCDPATVRIRLHTGRSHQIRVQFASRGYPLVGDHKYGAKDDVRAPMLYSCCITFPWKEQTLRFEKLPDWAIAE